VTFNALKLPYTSYLKGLDHKPIGIKRGIALLRRFQNYLDSQNSSDLRDIGPCEIIGFLESLKEEGLSPGTLKHYASKLRRFFRWMQKNNLIIKSLYDQVPHIVAESTHKVIFTPGEMKRFLESIEDSLRDRCYFELLYSSALRCIEAAALCWRDINPEERVLKITHAKGSHERFVPFSYQAAGFLRKWRDEGSDKKSPWVFAGQKGAHLSECALRGRFRAYLGACGIGKKGLTIHSIRHSCATHLLESGADIRYVSELLGHSSLESTVVYTHPSSESQRRSYRMYHPRENGYDKEIDDAYRCELERLRKKLEERAEFIRRYVHKD